MPAIQRLNPGQYSLAQELVLFFQTDDGVENPQAPGAEYLRNALENNDFFMLIALDGDQIAGGLTAYALPMYKRPTREMFLFEIGVKPRYRRQGVGKRLVEYLLALCREREIGIMFVATSRKNTAAVRMYETTGGLADPDSILFTYADV